MHVSINFERMPIKLISLIWRRWKDMEEHTLLCKKCRHIFKLPGALLNDILSCPQCGVPDIVEAPPWAPLGSGMNIFDDSLWEYECQQCQNKFKLPIPQSPAEEKSRKCPSCCSDHIHRLTAVGGEPLYCG
jgi:rRNA maturation endonuclease Nob1